MIDTSTGIRRKREETRLSEADFNYNPLMLRPAPASTATAAEGLPRRRFTVAELEQMVSRSARISSCRDARQL